MAPQILDTQGRLYTAHAWQHTDTIYMLANGDLLLEDPILAGVRLGYPWAGHVYQALLSYLCGSPPASNYIWANLLWLLFIYGFSAGIVAELGGNHFSRIASVVWLSFGVNFVGYTLQHIVFYKSRAPYPIWMILGDIRYTPWVLKFLFFNQMPFALGVFIALVFLAIKQWPDSLTRSYLTVICLLLCSLGIIYPILFPPAFVVIGARILVILSDKYGLQQAGRYRQIVWLGLVLLVAGLLTSIHFQIVTQDRVTGGMQFSRMTSAARKAVESVVVTLPLLAGLGVMWSKSWRAKRGPTIILISGALVSYILYATIRIGPQGIESQYKFIFTAAICLTPFLTLALEPFWNRLGRWALPTFAVISLILAAPLAHKTFKNRAAWIGPNPPLADVRTFDLRLATKERFAGLYDAIRDRTPTNSLLVTEDAELNLPTLTRRRLYVPPAETTAYPGINLLSTFLLVDIKGYDKQILHDRRLVLKQLYATDSGTQRAQWLDQILKFNRPVALIVDEGRHAALLEWLTTERYGRSLYKEDGLSLWLIEPTKRG
jgi:hypothetical protein